jgi:hypothetical protein
MVASRMRYVQTSPHKAFAPIQRIGGLTGWYSVDWFWRLRGSLDKLRGGERMRRGRIDPDSLHVGDTVDFWRVERIDSDTSASFTGTCSTRYTTRSRGDAARTAPREPTTDAPLHLIRLQSIADPGRLTTCGVLRIGPKTHRGVDADENQGPSWLAASPLDKNLLSAVVGRDFRPTCGRSRLTGRRPDRCVCELARGVRCGGRRV